ncbi:MAG TPA: alpha/beta fold hydrolase, partial [Rudaea sp.]|nr:alpha/beta fold hydrolase [Rudaea sp.]
MHQATTAFEPERIALDGADGVPLAVEAHGDVDAPALVFAHGFGQTRHAWDASAATLARAGWRCLAMDARGHGDSGWRNDGRYDFSQFVDDLMRLARIPADKPILVGAS